MAKTQLPREKIQAKAKATLQLSERDNQIFAIAESADVQGGDNANPYIALKYFRDAYECFSHWEKDELKAFTELINDLRNRTWKQVLQTSGKRDKRGLAYTPYDPVKTAEAAKTHLESVRDQISPDITFFELRVDQNKLRVHGFRARAAFFLVLLDREHRVFPS
ncbi:hypothetical protein [Comamonas testosteroni]|uniref:hypothetical protein n=1 Tax=Comamonas testosteroni TaxID=285 RepID=UPI00024644F4|nr:hypothetical protein [Comamonas testosteroni]EHN66380.1 hypothetical protein CTATCC11996_07673 [Comamonas testosteroni ATCC 11996]QQN72080.1 hypothetical protein IYN88_12125 [Comamonas testosteroni]